MQTGRLRRWIGVFMVTLAATTLLTVGCGGGGDDTEDASTRIVFAKSDEGNADLFTIAGDGSSLARILDWPDTDEFWPVYSPDRSKIAFVSFERPQPGDLDGSDTRARLYVMNADGTNPQQITAVYHINTVSWSPDGTRLVHDQSVRQPDGDAKQEIVVRSADGIGEQVVASRGVWPIWSPDGSDIVYTSQENDSYYQLRVISRDGTNPRPLIPQSSYYNKALAWSPDGSALLIWRRVNGGLIDPGPHEIHLFTPSTGEVRRVLAEADAGQSGSARISGGNSWSADGQTIFLVRFDGLFRCDRDGSNERRILEVE